MHRLLERVEKELENISNKGLNSSNLDTAYKLIDIYKDIKESSYYDEMAHKGETSYGARARDSRGRFMDSDSKRLYDRTDDWGTERYGLYPYEDKIERHLTRMRDGVDKYNIGKERYRDGGSQDRMIDGIEMTMEAITMFIESLCDLAETSQEKEIIRKHINKLKNI